VEVGDLLDAGKGPDQLGEREPQLVLDRTGDGEHRVLRHRGRRDERHAEPGEVTPTTLTRG
jgi:hypothetical protein